MQTTRETAVAGETKELSVEYMVLRFDGCHGTPEKNYADKFPYCEHVVWNEDGTVASAPTAETPVLAGYWHKNPLYRLYFKITGKALGR